MITASLHTCPQCGRPLQFSHGQTTMVQCGCGTAVQRFGDKLQAVPVPLLMDAVEFIQPGTTGVWQGKTFRITGRIRAWLDEFVFNYWTVIWADDSIGYIGEGYGLFAVYESLAVNDREVVALTAETRIGSWRKVIDGKEALLERRYACHRWELEGEAWLPFTANTFTTFEWAFTDGERIEAIEWGRDRFSCFRVSYTTLNNLQLINTRGGTTTGKSVACPNCSTQHTLKAYPYSQCYSCTKCGTYYALDTTRNFRRDNDRNLLDFSPAIPLGAVGQLNGVAYEVVGFIQKQEKNVYKAKWREYTLYNREQGFAFLSEYDGHWTLLRERGDAPVLASDATDVLYEGDERFERYNRYKYNMLTAAGEAPYNAFNDEGKSVTEFISPPEIWIQERDGREGIVWFKGEHLPGKAVAEAFGESVVLPWQVGVGAVDPKGFVSREKLAKVAGVVIAVTVLAHILTSLTHRKQVLFDQAYSFSDSSNTTTIVSERFTLDKWRSNLEFDLFAAVDNSWAEVSATLVDVNKGTERSFEKGVEYYHGYSDGESWSEGSRTETAFLSEVPAGTYQLQIQATRESSPSFGSLNSMGTPTTAFPTISNFSIKTTYDTTNERNLWLILIPLVLWPLGQYVWVYYNEVRRWSNSPFSPYTKHQDD